MKFQVVSELVGKPVADLHFRNIRSGNRRRDITCEIESIHSIKDPYVSSYVHERLKNGLVSFTLRNDGVWRVVNSSYLALRATDDEGSKLLESTLAEVTEENRSREPRPKRLNPKYDLIPGRRYVAIDVETTGLDPFSGDRIIQLAALDITDFAHSNGELGHKMEAVVMKFNPQMPIPKEASAVNRIYDRDVADSPLFSEFAEFFINFIGDAVLVGHNVKFDIDCLNAEFDRLGKSRLKNDSYCTYRNSRNKLEGRSNYRGRFNLEAVRKHLNVPSDGRWHDALNDAKVAARLFNVLVRMDSNATEISKNSLVETSIAVSLPESPSFNALDQMDCEFKKLNNDDPKYAAQKKMAKKDNSYFLATLFFVVLAFFVILIVKSTS